MRIIPYTGDDVFEDNESLEIIIKTVPFENGYAPLFYISSPSDEYVMKIDELSTLMDGIEIARRNIDEIIDFLLRSKLDE